LEKEGGTNDKKELKIRLHPAKGRILGRLSGLWITKFYTWRRLPRWGGGQCLIFKPKRFGFAAFFYPGYCPRLA